MVSTICDNIALFWHGLGDGIQAAIVSSVLTAMLTACATWKVQRNLFENGFERKRRLMLVGFKTDLESLRELFEKSEKQYKEYLQSGQSDIDVNPYSFFRFSVEKNYVVFYENNIGNMGLLRDEKLTKQIIKTYLSIKCFYEDLHELYKISERGIEMSISGDHSLNRWMRERHRKAHEECFKVLQDVYKSVDDSIELIDIALK